MVLPLEMQETWAWPILGCCKLSFPPALFLASLLHPATPPPHWSPMLPTPIEDVPWLSSGIILSAPQVTPLCPNAPHHIQRSQPYSAATPQSKQPIPRLIELFRRGDTMPFPSTASIHWTHVSLRRWALWFLSEAPGREGSPPPPTFSLLSTHWSRRTDSPLAWGSALCLPCSKATHTSYSCRSSFHPWGFL